MKQRILQLEKVTFLPSPAFGSPDPTQLKVSGAPVMHCNQPHNLNENPIYGKGSPMNSPAFFERMRCVDSANHLAQWGEKNAAGN